MESTKIKVGRTLTTRPSSLDLIPSEKGSGGSRWGRVVLPEKNLLGAGGSQGASVGRVMRKPLQEPIGDEEGLISLFFPLLQLQMVPQTITIFTSYISPNSSHFSPSSNIHPGPSVQATIISLSWNMAKTTLPASTPAIPAITLPHASPGEHYDTEI